MPLGRTSVKASCSPGMTAQHASLLLLLVSVSGIMLPQIVLTPCQGCYLFPLPQDSRVWFCCLCYCSTNVRTISIRQHLMDTNMEMKGTQSSMDDDCLPRFGRQQSRIKLAAFIIMGDIFIDTTLLIIWGSDAG